MESNRRRTVGPEDNELDSALCSGEPAIPGRSPEEVRCAGGADKAVTERTAWVEAERREGVAK